MFPYVGVFLVTIIAAACYDYLNRRPTWLNHIPRLLFAVIVILVPAVLAGLRDINIGVDIQVYVVPTFNSVKGSSSIIGALSNVNNISYVDSINIGFIFLEYIVSILGGDIHWMLFAISLVNGIFVFIASKVLRRYTNLWVIELVYLTMLYNASYNVIRQSMAICMCIIAFAYLIRKNVRRFIIITVASMLLFHNTAVLVLLLLPLYYWMRKRKGVQYTNNSRKIRYYILAGVTILIILFLRPLVGVVDRIFSWNFSRYWGYYKSDLSILRFVVYVITMLPLYFYAKKERHREIITLTAIVDFLTYLLSFNIFYFFRISMYFMMLGKAIGYAEIIHSEGYTVKRQLTINKRSVMVVLTCIIYWLYTFVYANMHETIPYLFM